MLKRRLETVIALCLVSSTILLSACGSGGGNSDENTAQNGETDFSGKEIEIATYLTGETLDAYKGVIAGFEEETGVEVTLDEYGDDYESTMKTRMAS